MSTALVICSVSCEDFLDINRSPNVPPDAPVEMVLPAAVASTAAVVGGDYAILGGLWSQYYTQSNNANQFKSEDAFNLQTSDYNASFNELYAGALNDYEFVRRKAKAEHNWSFYLISTVMQAYTFQVLVDLYDDIPFSEALNGDANRAPVYEQGEVIYDSLIVRIDDALAKDFNEQVAGIRSSKNPGLSDFVFGDEFGAGDDLDELVDENIENWTKFANTLKLKIYLRQIKSRPTVADAGIQALFDDGAEFLTEDAAMTQFVDLPNQSNPMYEYHDRTLGNSNLRASRTLLSFLQATSDTRIPRFYNPGSGGQRALDQGNYEAPTTVIVPATISSARILATDATYFISESESYFLQAEAALRGYGGDEEVLFDAGVDASFAQYGLAPMNFDLPGTSLEADLEQIITQKWVAMAGTHQGIEAFFERNRTDYPVTSTVYSGDGNGNVNPAYVPGQFVYPREGVTSGVFAKRLLFPDTERRRNPNTPAQEPLTEPVWWDVD